MLELRIVKGSSGVGQTVPLFPGRSLTIGRAETCDVRLVSPGISKAHCRVSCLPGSRVEVEDLGSSNGTLVNGVLVKKHLVRPGDMISLHDFVLEVAIKAPEQFAEAAEAKIDVMATPVTSSARAQSMTLAEKVDAFLGSNIYPLADGLGQKIDVRLLVGGFFLIWSVLIVVFTISPMSDRANQKVMRESTQVAQLYARQLVRVNLEAVVEQRYRDLITELDSRPGQTPGIVRAVILDSSKAQILAPADLLGKSLPNQYAVNAIQKEEEAVQFDKRGFAYVSAPIKIGMQEGGGVRNKVVAVAFVEYDAEGAQFTLASLVDQAVNSLLYAILLSLLFLVFVYRWINGSVSVTTDRLDAAIRSGESSLAPPVSWPALAALCEQISFVMAKAGNGASSMGGGDSGWASAGVRVSGTAAAAFDSSLTVLDWNAKMERVIGIRANMAIGSHISQASRDVAFESTIRELSLQAQASPWNAASKAIEFSGIPYTINMIFGQDAYLVTIVLKDE